jgi:hypothetical protein
VPPADLVASLWLNLLQPVRSSHPVRRDEGQ